MGRGSIATILKTIIFKILPIKYTLYTNIQTYSILTKVPKNIFHFEVHKTKEMDRYSIIFYVGLILYKAD